MTVPLNNFIFQTKCVYTRSTIHNYQTKHRNNLVTTHVRLLKSINSQVYQQLKIFNKLTLDDNNE